MNRKGFAYRSKQAVTGSIWGAVLGALILGLGGRAVMRILAYIDGREAGFSLGGSLEVMLYGTIVGLIGGALFPFAIGGWFSKPWGRGTLFGLLVLCCTVLTLPSHIADTAVPFDAIMPLVYLLFAIPFILYGIALRRLMVPKS